MYKLLVAMFGWSGLFVILAGNCGVCTEVAYGDCVWTHTYCGGSSAYLQFYCYDWSPHAVLAVYEGAEVYDAGQGYHSCMMGQ